MRIAFGPLSMVCVLAALMFGCSGNTTQRTEGEWLGTCGTQSACGSDAKCICGTCTRLCSVDSQCMREGDASCFDPSSDALLRRCEERGSTPAQGVCFARCGGDASCGSGQACVEGACLPAESPTGSGGKSSGGGQANSGGGGKTSGSGGKSSGSGSQISDFKNVSSKVDWNPPVAAPMPEQTIAGADDRIVGSWRQASCEPSQPQGCLRFTIERSAAGSMNGNVQLERAAAGASIQPAQDPDLGYPIGVDPSRYSELSGLPPAGVSLRMLDARLDGERLSFSWSGFDLWHGWCGLQTPNLWKIGDRSFYFCAPQDASAQAAIDRGKIVLCTSAAFLPLCADGQGGMLPCVCMGGSDPRCSKAYCQCDSKSCDADVSEGYRLELSVQGERMSGTVGSSTTGGTMAIEFDRVTP